MNLQAFFHQIRVELFAGMLTQRQVDGINAILAEWNKRQLTDLRWLADILATAYWETTNRMVAVSEDGGNAYFFRMYDINGERPNVARMLGNVNPGDGILFHGRGLPQLTGRNNYRNMGHILKWPLEDHPDLALDPTISVQVMFEGMLRADSGFGDFTGVALEDFFNDTVDNPVDARRIINGLDHATEIATIQSKFLVALRLP